MVLFDFPRLAAVVRLLALPMERLGCDLTEGPTQREPVGIRSVEHDVRSVASALRRDDIVSAVALVVESDASIGAEVSENGSSAQELEGVSDETAAAELSEPTGNGAG